MTTGQVTTGLTPLTVGSSYLFVGNFFLNGLWWDLTGGTASLEFADPAGSLFGPYPASITGGVPSVTWQAAGLSGTWTRAWVIQDARGRVQVSRPIAFALEGSPR